MVDRDSADGSFNGLKDQKPEEALPRIAVGAEANERTTALSTCINKFPMENSLSPNDLDKLKLIAVRLNLQTRRGSYMTWRSKLVSSLCKKGSSSDMETCDSAAMTTNQSDEQKLAVSKRDNAQLTEKWRRLHGSISYIKTELTAMKQQDQALARQLVCLRNEMQQLRLQHSKQLYDDMVDDAQWTIAENEQLEGVCDEPRTLDKNPLLNIGITKMNLTERRFSVF